MNPPKLFLSIILFLGLFFLTPSCSDSPTETSSPGESDATGHVDPQGATEFLLGTVMTAPSSGRVEVWARNLRVHSDGVVSFDAVIVNTSRTDVRGPIHFVITEIRPDIVEILNADFIGADGPVFDYSDDVGDDGILEAGEASSPVNMRFLPPEPIAFAIGFRIDAGIPSRDGFISGVVFNDLNGDGEFDMNHEHGIPGVIVELRPSAREILYRIRTDERGRYAFHELMADVYKAMAHSNNVMRPTTANPLIVTLIQRPDGSVTSLDDAHFGFLVDQPPGPPIFGPIAVGPASPFGSTLDSTFVVPDFFAAVDLFLTVEPPHIMGPFPLRIDEAAVAINGTTVWEFVCELPDSVCMPTARILLDPNIMGWENTIHIRAHGDPMSFLMFRIDAETIMDPNRSD